MLTLFRCLTGEDWNLIMGEIVDDGHDSSPYMYFTSYIVLGNFMLLNLCVAVILEAFAEFVNSDDDAEAAKNDLLKKIGQFKAAWLRHDPGDRLFMPAYRVVAFLEELPPPLGLPDAAEMETPRSPRSQRQSFIGAQEKALVGAALDKAQHQTAHRVRSHSDSPAKGRGHEWAYRLSHRQRFTIEFVRDMRIKVNEDHELFYLDVLMACMHNGSHEVDVPSGRRNPSTDDPRGARGGAATPVHGRGTRGVAATPVHGRSTSLRRENRRNPVFVSRRGRSRAQVDLSTIEDDSTTELNVMLLRTMGPRLRRMMRDHSFRHDLPELDLTATLNAAVTLQEAYRARKRRGAGSTSPRLTLRHLDAWRTGHSIDEKTLLQSPSTKSATSDGHSPESASPARSHTPLDRHAPT